MPCFFERRPILSGLTEALSVSFIAQQRRRAARVRVSVVACGWCAGKAK